MTVNGRDDTEAHDEDATERPAFYTMKEAADLLRISVQTANRLARNGQFPGAIQIGRSWRVSADALDAHRQRPAVPRPGTPSATAP